MNFGEFVRSKRLEKDLFLWQVAAISGMSTPMVCRIETGKRVPDHPEKLAKALGVSEGELKVRAMLQRAGFVLDSDKIAFITKVVYME